MTLTFKRIVCENIFNADFADLSNDNQLPFPDSRIVVIYGPNGVGKSSLASVLSGEKRTEYVPEYDGKEFDSAAETSPSHIISDQNGRNIIQGSTGDSILGDNIRREHQLKEAIEQGFRYVFESVLIPRLKSRLRICYRMRERHHQ